MNGIINVYKERGYTSHDVVAKLRGILKQKRSDTQELSIRKRREFFLYVWEKQRSCVTCWPDMIKFMRQ